jgi:uncharacterized protein (TIGR03083 family)
VDAERLMREERADFAAFLGALTSQQWQAPTLCAQWRVRDVVAHVISYDNVNVRGLLSLAAEGRFRLSRINDVALARYSTRSPEQLMALLNDHPQLGRAPAALVGRARLVETLIHHQDIRRALALPRSIPPERLLTALRTAMIAPDVAGPWRIRGLRLIATDLDYSAGIGPEVWGAAEPLLMAIAGRPAALSELSGPGRAKLARRICSR